MPRRPASDAGDRGVSPRYTPGALLAVSRGWIGDQMAVPVNLATNRVIALFTRRSFPGGRSLDLCSEICFPAKDELFIERLFKSINPTAIRLKIAHVRVVVVLNREVSPGNDP